MGECKMCDGTGQIWLDEETTEECTGCDGQGFCSLINKDESVVSKANDQT